jgi:hypothetical protein
VAEELWRIMTPGTLEALSALDTQDAQDALK